MEARIASVALLFLSTFGLSNADRQALAQDAPGDASSPVRIASLVKDLGSPSFERRHTANVALAEIGDAARQQIELASGSEDPEVRMRAGQLLRRLKVDALWTASPVELATEPTPASDAIAELSRQTGNRLLTGDQYGAFHSGSVSLPSGPRTYWPTVDEICRQTENRVRLSYDSRPTALVFVAGCSGQFPIAYAGPVRASIQSARRVFVDNFNYRDTTSDASDTLQLNMQLAWEDRFRLVAYQSQLNVNGAVDDTGNRTTSADATNDQWEIFEGGRQQMKTAIRLRPPSLDATELETLTVRWPVIAVGDMATLETDNLDTERPIHGDDAELIIEKVRQRGSQWEIRVRVSRDLAVPEPREILFVENEFELLDDEGEAYPVKNITKLGITASTTRLKLTFVADSPARSARKLRMRYPRVRDQRDLSITFRNVPLPTTQPK